MIFIIICATIVVVQANDFIVNFQIDYGRIVTEYNTVTLCLDIKDSEDNLRNVTVEFSLDNITWKGYDVEQDKWIDNHKSIYQPYYPSFPIGDTEGLKTIYVRIIDGEGDVKYYSSKISYSPDRVRPVINAPITVNSQDKLSTDSDNGITNGNGTEINPYIIKNNQTRLVLDAPNASRTKYSIDGTNWSEWLKVDDEKIDIPITFDSNEGRKMIFILARNQYGIDSSIKKIYYLLDTTSPHIDVPNDKNLIAINNNLSFEFGLNDNIIGEIDFKIEMFINGSLVSKKGKIKQYFDNKLTITSVNINGLPIGIYKAKIIANDQAGNISTKSFIISNK